MVFLQCDCTHYAECFGEINHARIVEYISFVRRKYAGVRGLFVQNIPYDLCVKGIVRWISGRCPILLSNNKEI